MMRVELSEKPIDVLRRALEECRKGIDYQRQEVARLEQETVAAKAQLQLAVTAEANYSEVLLLLGVEDAAAVA
jgi:hypothetical protein